ncbi:hypothetical protein [Paenibacillus sp.]|uniref:hypothetical protein n=1 Tax=Paenibacillus sp. TaxID=58172 RepID=UPI00281249EC|nr:hypothetical protein [Paenibacillus sp.]
MTISTYEELDRFGQGMAEHLVGRLRYGPDDAVRLLREYAPVLELLGKHYNCEDYAERIHEAHANGLTPERWIERIRELERPAVRSTKKTTKKETRGFLQ